MTYPKRILPIGSNTNNHTVVEDNSNPNKKVPIRKQKYICKEAAQYAIYKTQNPIYVQKVSTHELVIYTDISFAAPAHT